MKIKKVKYFNVICFWLMFICATTCMYGQGMNNDALTITKVWLDDLGEQMFYIHVEGACNNYDKKNEFLMYGSPSTIRLKLTNDLGSRIFNYVHPDYETSSLMVYSEAIWMMEYDLVQAVFIPVFYCSAQHGAIMPLSYIILYRDEIVMVHFNFSCKPGVLGTCSPKFSKIGIAEQLRSLPQEVRVDFLKYIEKKYTSREDLYPNHMTFNQSKYKDYNLASAATVEQGSYPQVLLKRILIFIDENKKNLAEVYLKEFEYLYLNEDGVVDISGFKIIATKRKIIHLGDLEQELQNAEQMIDIGDFQSSYQLIKLLIQEL